MGLLADYMPNWLPNDPNQNTAARQGLLQFGAALLGGKGNFGSILGQGLQAGAGGYNTALSELQKKALLDAQTQHLTLDNQAQQSDMTAQQGIRTALGSPAPVASAPAVPLVTPAGLTAPIASLPQIGAPATPDAAAPAPQAAAPTAPPDAYQQAVADYLKVKPFGMKYAKPYLDAIKELRPDVKEVKTVTLPDGSRALANIFADGRPPQVLSGVAPDKEKLVGYGAGGTYNFADPFSGKTVNSAPITQSPDSIATVDEMRRGHNLAHSDAQATSMAPEYKQDISGNWVALPKKVAPGEPIRALPVMGADGKPMNAAPKPLTESQGKATTFAARMLDSEQTIGQLEKDGVQGSDYKTIAAGSPLTNWYASPKGQMYRQAQENWVTANLRQESGAAIGKDEMDKDIRKFFPTVGDQKEVIAQKEHARQVAAQGMLTQAGPGADSARKIANVQPVDKLPKKPPAAAAPPAVGTVQSGYKFKGGNPAVASNWDKA